MNETGARVHEVRLLLVCIVECSGSGRDDMDGCLLPASEYPVADSYNVSLGTGEV